MEERSPKRVIVKAMTVNKKTGVVHNFFENMKFMEMGGAIRPGSLRKGNDGWWTFYHNIAGESRMKHISDPKFGILDHTFIGGGLEWHVFVRIIPNEDGSTVTWTFIKPDGISEDQFEKQAKKEIERSSTMYDEKREVRTGLTEQIMPSLEPWMKPETISRKQ